MQFLSHSTQETEAIGEELAQKLRGGDVLAFTGSLGMGKTASLWKHRRRAFPAPSSKTARRSPPPISARV